VRFRPYSKYKPSGVEWLGDVPEHWEVKRLKYCATINDEALAETTPADYELEYVDIGGVSAVEGITATEQFIFENSPSRARRRVRHGDTIVSTVRTYLRAIAPIKNPPDNLIVSTGFAVVRPRKVDSSFLAYSLRESSFVESVVARSVGVSYPAVNATEVGGICSPLPPCTEQQAIAAFLDRETAKVDWLVAKKQELIEKLKERRTALISRTVTRGLPPAAARAAGLNSHPKLKPSGIASIGECPASWNVTPLMHLTDLNRQVMYGIVLPGPDVDEGVPIVKGGDVKPGRLAAEFLCKTTFEIEMGFVRSRLKGGDIVFSIRGTIGEVALVPDALEGANITQDVARVAPRKGIDVRWLSYALRAEPIVSPLLSLSLGAAVRGVNIRDLKRVRICCPLAKEQRAIADHLDRETAKFDRLIEKVAAAVAKLQEYRAALITAAVTGKIDVRKAVS